MNHKIKILLMFLFVIIIGFIMFGKILKTKYYLYNYKKSSDAIFYQNVQDVVSDSIRSWIEKNYRGFEKDDKVIYKSSKYLYFNSSKDKCITFIYEFNAKPGNSNIIRTVCLFKKNEYWNVFTYSLPTWYYFDDVIRGSNVTYQIQQYYDKYEEEFLDRMVPKYYKYFFCINDGMFNYEEKQLLKKHNKLKYRHLK